MLVLCRFLLLWDVFQVVKDSDIFPSLTYTLCLIPRAEALCIQFISHWMVLTLVVVRL